MSDSSPSYVEGMLSVLGYQEDGAAAQLRPQATVFA